MTRPLRLVRVTWGDAYHIAPGEWFDPDGVDLEPCACITIGMLVAESSTAVLVAHSVQEDGDVTGGFVIPKSNIVSIETLAGID